MLSDGMIVTIFLHLNTYAVRAHTISPSNICLPFGLMPTDGPNDVRIKIGMDPFSSQYVPGRNASQPTHLWEEYVTELGCVGLKFLFIFDSTTGIQSITIAMRQSTNSLQQTTSQQSYGPEKYQTSQHENLPLLVPSKIMHQVLNASQEEARRLRHDSLGTETILLGILAFPNCPSAALLISMGIDLCKARQLVIKLLGQGAKEKTVELPLSAQAKELLKASAFRARQENSDSVNTIHCLLALIEEDRGIGRHVLRLAGIQISDLQNRLQRLLNTNYRDLGTI
jgi:hypothetical protein